MNANIIDVINAEGVIEINGIWVYTKAQIIAEQKIWWEGDEAKNIDFSGCEYWLIADNGHHLGVNAEELEEVLKEYGIIA